MCSIDVGISNKVTCLLLLRRPVYKQRELNTGVCMERENQSLQCQEKTSSKRHCKKESIDVQHWDRNFRSSVDSCWKKEGAKGSCFPAFKSLTKTELLTSRSGGTKMIKAKPFSISRRLVQAAYQKVKSNRGSVVITSLNSDNFFSFLAINSTRVRSPTPLLTI